MSLVRLWVIVGAMLLFLPLAVISSWPALLWWMALLLSRSARPWAATTLSVLFGLQIGVLTQRLLGLDVLLFGGTVALLELWSDMAAGWRRHVGDLLFGSFFCAVFLLAGNDFVWGAWLTQAGLLLLVGGVQAGWGAWWNRK